MLFIKFEENNVNTLSSSLLRVRPGRVACSYLGLGSGTLAGYKAAHVNTLAFFLSFSILVTISP